MRDDSSCGSAPATSYVVRTSSWTRKSRSPATLTTSGSSTPASCTLVPDAVLCDPVVVGSVGAVADASERVAEPIASNITIGPASQP